jgi:hypothetical protein
MFHGGIPRATIKDRKNLIKEAEQAFLVRFSFLGG